MELVSFESPAVAVGSLPSDHLGSLVTYKYCKKYKGIIYKYKHTHAYNIYDLKSLLLYDLHLKPCYFKKYFKITSSVTFDRHLLSELVITLEFTEEERFLAWQSSERENTFAYF